MRTRYGLHEKENPLFKLNIDLYKYSNTHAVMLTVQYIMYSCYHLHRSSPVEALHTVLLGCCKYMLRQYMNTKSPSEKKKIMGRIRSFPKSGLNCRVTSSISYFKSFVGRDFKALMQMALFVFTFNDQEKKCWYLLSKVTKALQKRREIVNLTILEF